MYGIACLTATTATENQRDHRKTAPCRRRRNVPSLFLRPHSRAVLRSTTPQACPCSVDRRGRRRLQQSVYGWRGDSRESWLKSGDYLHGPASCDDRVRGVCGHPSPSLRMTSFCRRVSIPLYCLKLKLISCRITFRRGTVVGGNAGHYSTDNSHDPVSLSEDEFGPGWKSSWNSWHAIFVGSSAPKGFHQRIGQEYQREFSVETTGRNRRDRAR